MTIRVSGLRAVSLALAMSGCADVTGPIRQTDSASGVVGPRGSVCATQIMSADAEVSVTVTPSSMRLVLRSGFCRPPATATPGAVVGSSSSGNLKIRVPAGEYHLEVENTSDLSVSYSVGVEYRMPRI